MLTVHFHGPSGSGKDTQVELLRQRYGFEQIGSGDMLRKMYASKDPDGIKAHEYTSAGKFVPDELMFKLYDKFLAQFDKSKHWALISLLRTRQQVEPLEKEIIKEGRKLDYFLHLNIDEQTAIERMTGRWICTTCGANYHEKFKPEAKKGYCDNDGTKLIKRTDDTSIEKLHSRLEAYHANIDPLLEEFAKRGNLIDIDGSGTIEEIHKEIVKRLGLQ